jgi:hypothetical protein
MIVINHCHTPAQTRDGICDFLRSEAARYRRDADREKRTYAKSLDVARCNALRLAVAMLEDAEMRADAPPPAPL